MKTKILLLLAALSLANGANAPSSVTALVTWEHDAAQNFLIYLKDPDGTRSFPDGKYNPIASITSISGPTQLKSWFWNNVPFGVSTIVVTAIIGGLESDPSEPASITITTSQNPNKPNKPVNVRIEIPKP